MNWNRRVATLAGLALLALTNGVALGGVAWNRFGQPDATLRLTQRELWTPNIRSDGRENENSGLALRLNWRTLPAPSTKEASYGLAVDGGNSPGWLDAAKLRSLGFAAFVPSRNRPEDDGARRHWQTTRSVLVVLELDGPASQEALRRAQAYAAAPVDKDSSASDKKEAQQALERESVSGSRLFAIDAGVDAATLRATYPDRSKYAIVNGRISLDFNGDGSLDRGAIQSLGVDQVNVPLAWRSVFDGVPPSYVRDADEHAKPFEATLAFGQRLEPWLVAAARR
jgi:hypothetical protein